MPPKGSRKLPMSEEGALVQGSTSLHSFFQKVPKSGRPLGSVHKARGPPKKRPLPPPASYTPAVQTLPSFPEPPVLTVKVKESRINWAVGDHLKKLTEAVNDWLNKTGELLVADPKMSMHAYAARVGIAKSTLHIYCTTDLTKRRQLGAHAGHPSLVTHGEQEFVVDVLRRRDRANDGMNPREAMDMLQDLKPELKKQQVKDPLLHPCCIPAAPLLLYTPTPDKHLLLAAPEGG